MLTSILGMFGFGVTLQGHTLVFFFTFVGFFLLLQPRVLKQPGELESVLVVGV